MRPLRLAGPAVLIGLLALTLTACARTDRPEGVVERWLSSLNQGAAGEPGRYAAGGVSEQVLPGWSALDPGELDVIEVGLGRPTGAAGEPSYVVPFRVVTSTGQTRRLDALLTSQEGTWRIEALRDPGNPPDPKLPSEGGPRIETAHAALWVAAAAAAAAFMVVSLGLMALVRKGSG
ncbi:MAG: hypothetical protein HY240_07950 [Actinobacteria bacterium]|nr:hypothetical protein [Actinomycetota bacterium]